VIAVYAGSFNPIHLGHIDIIKRAVKIFGSVIVIVTDNSTKHYAVSVEDRMSLVQKAVEFEMLDTYVQVICLKDGQSVADFCLTEYVDVLIRGIRSGADLSFELMMAEVNRDNKIDTVFLPCDPAHSNFSSTMVRECVKYSMPITRYVPIGLMPIIKDLYKEEKQNACE
jgi:pantetheine-phosphate adenylyltransferase